MKAMKLEEITADTNSDHCLKALRACTKTNEWNTDPFKATKDEFTVTAQNNYSYKKQE